METYFSLQQLSLSQSSKKYEHRIQIAFFRLIESFQHGGASSAVASTPRLDESDRVKEASSGGGRHPRGGGDGGGGEGQQEAGGTAEETGW